MAFVAAGRLETESQLHAQTLRILRTSHRGAKQRFEIEGPLAILVDSRLPEAPRSEAVEWLSDLLMPKPVVAKGKPTPGGRGSGAQKPAAASPTDLLANSEKEIGPAAAKPEASADRPGRSDEVGKLSDSAWAALLRAAGDHKRGLRLAAAKALLRIVDGWPSVAPEVAARLMPLAVERACDLDNEVSDLWSSILSALAEKSSAAALQVSITPA